MKDAEKQLLEDAIMTAIKGEIKNTKLKIAVCVLSALAAAELVALIVMLFR